MELLRYFIVVCLILYVDTKTFRHYGYEFDEDAKVWFKLHRFKATWYEARDICRQEGAILASPLNNPMKDALQSYSRSYNIDKIFVGVHATFVNGLWHTLEGVPIEELMHLDISQINDDKDQCSVLNAGSLISVKCSEKYPYMCYKRENSQQLTSCGTDREYILNKRTDRCYKFHKDKVTWYDAFKICSQEQAYLAIITTRDEIQVVKDIDFENLYSFENHRNRMIELYNDVINIGFIDWKGNLMLHAIHESFNNSEARSASLYEDTYSRSGTMYRQYPNKEKNTYCGSITSRGELVAVSCFAEIAFLCEKKVTNMDSFEENSSRTTKNMPESENLRNAVIYNEYLRK